jgi:hypothetical protein
MMIREIQRPRLWVTTPAVRRWIAILGAIAIVWVSFAHCIHHLNGSMPDAGAQADLLSVDDAPNTPKSAALTVEHCLGCSMIAVASFLASFTPELTATDLPVPRLNEYRAHPPLADTPPPKSI